MTTLALPERWTVNGTDVSSYATFVTSTQGVDELPPVRGESPPRSGMPGRRYLDKLLDARRWALVMTVTSLSASGVSGGNTQTRTNLDALLGLLGPRRQLTVTRLMPDGTTRTTLCECVAVNSVTDRFNHELVTLVAQFQSDDPHWYGASTTGPGSQATTSSPKDFNFTHPGNVRGNRIVVDYTGPITNPRLTNNTTGAYVDVAVVVASAKHLLIDADAYTALNDGVDATPSLTHGPTVPYMDMASGVNALRVTSTSPGGSVLVTLVPGYY